MKELYGKSALAAKQNPICTPIQWQSILALMLSCSYQLHSSSSKQPRAYTSRVSGSFDTVLRFTESLQLLNVILQKILI